MQIAAARPSDPTVCDFRAINKFVTSYFGGPEAKVVKGLVALMETAGAGSDNAQDRGFDVMVHIADNVDDGNPNFADASSLTNSLLVCMFSDTADLPESFPENFEDFTVATDPDSNGGYAVRGGATDPSLNVLSRPLDHPFSGIAPAGTTTWPQMLSGNDPPARILVYGRPGSTNLTYDWKVVPRSAAFSPPAIVGVCIDKETVPTSLLHEEHVGLLRFVDAAFLISGVCSPTALQSSAWPLRVARSFMRWGADLFAPRSLSASSTVDPGGLGGSTGGIRSVFGPQEIPPVDLTLLSQPADATVNIPIPSTTGGSFVVQESAGGQGIPGTLITLQALDNNGANVQLSCPGGCIEREADADGFVDFGNPTLNKTGGYRFVASGSVAGRPGITVNPTTSVRFNVRP